jgi:hypothetical protein
MGSGWRTRSGATLTLRRLDGTREEIVAQHPADRVELLLSGWTPDGQALLFHLGEAEAGEGLPRGVEAGFYRVRVADLKPTRVVGLAGFDAWLPDGGAVVYQRERGDGERTALMRAELAPGTKPTLLHEVGGSPGFDQLTLRGDEIVYVNDQALVRSKLDGSGRDELTARGEFAQYQRPRRSPDGTRVAYLDERTIKVIALGEMATRATRVTMTVCEVRRCEYAWESDAALLVVDSGGLWRIGLDGAASRIADRVLGLAVAGE